MLCTGKWKLSRPLEGTAASCPMGEKGLVDVMGREWVDGC